ncbi:hypothetical protein ACSMX9_00360 [Streptomyces sp. LE64]|uniref:hypothetical protein n=1 Tax=Streptomyces sp. LE64 TaxID=3448653 RepID=UPI004042026C
MSAPARTAPGAAPDVRVRSVRHHHARRGGRTTVRGRAYTAYLLVLFGLFYGVPVVRAASTAPTLVPLAAADRTVAAVSALAVAACAAAPLLGRLWGPLVMRPFLLHVFTTTDIPPTHYLGAIARRRLAYAGTTVLLATASVGYLTTDLFDRLDTALPGLALAAGLGALTGAAWLWGQVRGAFDHLALVAAAGVVGVAVTVAGRAAPEGTGAPWLLAGALTLAAAALGRVAFRSLAALDLARLARESARASQARAYAWTGTLHHAFDLYRPEPRARTAVLVRADGRLRGHLARGAVRALRTPGRALAAAVFLPAGGAGAALGAAGPESGRAFALWAAGAICLYLGSGWVGETWRDLREELTLAPLFGDRWGTAPARALVWPVVAVPVGAFPGAALALLVPPTALPTGPADTALLVAGSVVVALGARFLREMKGDLPLELLLPVLTPLGDLSGLRVLRWQFDGVVAVVLGIALLDLVPSAPAGTALGAVVAGCCVHAGLRRTGWARRGPLPRLGWRARRA